MLIIPLSNKLNWGNLPWITLGIIFLNAFIFFVFQSGDSEKYAETISFYFESDLAQIEIGSYIKYLEGKKGTKTNIRLNTQEKIDTKKLEKYFHKMQQDDKFLLSLENEEIITSQDHQYAQWKKLRSEYKKRLSGILSHRFGFIPSSKSVLTSLTYMFLHGSFMHLLGNMIFLWLVGCVLEIGCGRPIYLGMYLITGISSAYFFAIGNPHSTMPLIGASGAIAGLMGAYALLYGKTKIRVFYSLGVYFDYAMVPAIILLPIWIGNEIFQLYYGGESQVAYLGHIGGLVSGALIAFILHFFLKTGKKEIFEEDPKNRIPKLMDQALKAIESLDMDSARLVINEILAIDKDNRPALIHLFNIDKLTPGDSGFHQTASKLFIHLIGQKADPELIYEKFMEYTSLSKTIRLDLDTLFRISSVFITNGYLKESEKILAAILKKDPRFPKLSMGLLNLGRAYLKKGDSESGKKCLTVLIKRFPDSTESQLASGLLKG